MDGTYNEIYTVKVRRDLATGSLLQQAWHKNGVLENPFGPAVVSYDKEGNVMTEMWMENHVASRPEAEGPAMIQYDPASQKRIREAYFLKGYLHRLHGPAEIARDLDGNIVEQSFYHYGKQVHQPIPKLDR